MPLRQGRGVHATHDAVVFMMRDINTGEVVPCTISAAALSRHGTSKFGAEPQFRPINLMKGI